MFVLVCLIALLSYSSLNSQTLEIVASFNVSQICDNDLASTEFTFANGSKTRHFFTLDLAKFIEAHFSKNQFKDEALLLAFEDNYGKTVYYSKHCFDSEIAVITPRLLLGGKVVALGDTLVFEDAGNANLSDFAKDLSRYKKNIVREKIKLQIGKSNNSNYFQNGTLIFPIDKSPDRWLKNVKRIIIYRII